MEHNDRPRFATLMKAMGETFGNTIPSKEKVELYFRVLSDLPVETVETAVYNLIRDRKITSTFPVPGEIRDALPGTGESAAILALDKVERAAQRIGAYQSIIFDDPVIHATIDALGGWVHIASEIPEHEWTWFKKDFLKTYQAMAKNPGREAPKSLPGKFEMQNACENRESPEPVYFGTQPEAVKKIEAG